MIYCGEAEGGSPSLIGETSPFVQELLAPLLGGMDVDLITGAEIGNNNTQSETFAAANPDNPNEIVVAYNDSRGRNARPDQHLRCLGLDRRRRDLHPPDQGQHRPKPVLQYGG